MRCAECQASAPDGSRFCPSCGRPMAGSGALAANDAKVDDVLVDRGRLGVHVTLRGTIESGDGAGARITAKSRATLFTMSCRMVVESFATTAR